MFAYDFDITFWLICQSSSPLFFFFNDTATTEIYTLSLHDALPISVHTRALNDLTAAVGLGELDAAAIRRELASRRPLHAPHLTLAAPTDAVLRVFHVMRAIQDEIGGPACSPYIALRTPATEDLLRALLRPLQSGLLAPSSDPPPSPIAL